MSPADDFAGLIVAGQREAALALVRSQAERMARINSGDVVVVGRNRWTDGLPSPLLTLVPGDRAFVESVMAFCDTIGVTYQNPHTFAIEESGVFPDVERIVRFAREVDPKGLLNPGKLGGTFFGNTGARRG